jgi:hypothetical protein
MGCALLSTVLANPEGIKFINEDKLLRQIANCFAEIDQVSFDICLVMAYEKEPRIYLTISILD